ncbi:MAG: hypothetical protein ABI639_08455 [Thermoanaerobaculia bacterium]
MKLLDPTSADRMQRRIDQINLVQRLGGGEQVNSYQMIKGKPALDRSTSLPTSCGESILAVFKVMRERNLLVSGKIWLVDGMLFSLEFDKPTEHLVDDASLTVLVELN